MRVPGEFSSPMRSGKRKGCEEVLKDELIAKQGEVVKHGLVCGKDAGKLLL